ncbi:uncharacterized protein EDB91DRAFT_340741 [Suillus paluster]|uniref:uncharacterized protein n=1 Tax=Suillus paluster TaxID=48578 RepID=UPI001B883AEC|nr:uncharacterized protein EDB91DRAFT_340741 [Suillus paluster]KAG1740829.1 hypothetical protein EDB91DRAFT_340741 [Suillus paluster]
MSFQERPSSDSYVRETFHYAHRQETTSLNPPGVPPFFGVGPPWSFSTSSHMNVVTASETGMIPPDHPFVAGSPQNFQGKMLLQRPTPFVDCSASRHVDDRLPVASPGTTMSKFAISQTIDSGWSTNTYSPPPPKLGTSPYNSPELISPTSHAVASSSSVWSVHGPVHIGTIHSLVGPEVLHEDHRTATLQGGPQPLTQVPHHISWYPQVEVVGSSVTAMLQSPPLRSRSMVSTLQPGNAPRRTVPRHHDTNQVGLQTTGTEPAGHDLASHSPLWRRRASWSSYADRPTKALRWNGFIVDEEDVRETRNINGGLIDFYLCRWTHAGQECGMHVMGDRARLARHIQRWHRIHAGHGQRQVPCRWGDCGKLMKRENIVRHIIATHLKIKWRCSVCRAKLSRDDASARHFERVKSCRNGVATVERGPEAQEVNVGEVVEF